MGIIAQQITAVRQNISDIAKKCGRNPSLISLVAVSKTRPATDIVAAYQAGQKDFGENYLQEAQEKISSLQHLPLVWHFIGSIRSNKTRSIAENFDWVHTLSSFKHAQRISDQRPAQLPPINACIQVNISHEDSKSGVEPGQTEHLAGQISQLTGIKLRGLMAIPQASSDKQHQRQAFAQLASLMARLNNRGFELDTLSMGMSGDMETAIEEGATMVRIGTAIFGERQKA